MRLRNSADYRSLLWVAIAITLVTIQYSDPGWVVYLSPLSCYFAIALGTVTHNHNHRPTFHGRRWNNAFGHVLTFFYGYPTLLWVPTHNLNHHHFVNRPGDATATWRYTNRNNFLIAITYPFVSGFHQREPIRGYMARIRAKKPGLYSRIRFQYLFWFGSQAFMLWLAAHFYHQQQVGLGLYLWFFACALPAFLSLTVIMVFNYLQHVHTDAWSERDHSRNFTGWWFNFLFFNNGYHTSHHDAPSLHWSKLPAAHAAVADSIDPRLNEKNVLWFLFRQYVLSYLVPSLATSQIGGDPGVQSVDSPAIESEAETQKIA